MRKRSTVAICLASAAATALSIAINLATDSVPHRLRPPLWLVGLALAILAVVVVVAEVRSGRRENLRERAADTDGELSKAAAVLARAVRDQWRREAAIRSLSQPQPLPLRWTSTARSVAASPESVLGHASPVGRIVRMHLRGDVDSVADMFWQLPNGQLVILGSPGAGKSALALLFTLRMLVSNDLASPVPVLLSLSSWNPRREDLLGWVKKRIHDDYPGEAPDMTALVLACVRPGAVAARSRRQARRARRSRSAGSGSR